jgi:glycosyltransferase involved in cell wall biosynthesis
VRQQWPAKVGLVHPRLDVRGGAENVVLWMARGLRERGHEVVVATEHFSPERWEDGDWDGVPVHALGSVYFHRRRRHVANTMARRLRGALRGCDVIVAHNAPAHVWAERAARGPRRPRVVWFCEEPSARFHWRTTLATLAVAAEQQERMAWAREALDRFLKRARKHESRGRTKRDGALDLAAGRRVDLVLGNSAFTAKNAERCFGRPVLPCLLGHPEPPIASRVPQASPPYVLWVTSPFLHKNAHGFLEAIRLAVHELGARDLVVRAVGLAGEDFEALAAAKGIADALRIEPWLSDAELDARVAGCRFLAYPPIDEPFGLVPLHAMAHGRAVLASNLGGPTETVLHGVTGLHADPLEPADMARALVALWRDPARCDALGEQGRARYRAEFDFDVFLDRFEAIAFK